MPTRFSFAFFLVLSIFFDFNYAFPTNDIEYEYEGEDETAFTDQEVEAMMRIYPLISLAETTREQSELMVSR